MSIPHALVWFRRDLRCHSQSLLFNAQQLGGKVSCLYLGTPVDWMKYAVSPRQIDLIAQRLMFLRSTLSEYAIPLYVAETETHETTINWLLDWITTEGITDIYAQEELTWAEKKRDAILQEKLAARGVTLHLDPTSTILPVGLVTNQQGEMYRVFSAFRRRWWQVFLTQKWPKKAVSSASLIQQSHFHASIEKTNLCDITKWQRQPCQLAGDDAAIHQQWQNFLVNNVNQYALQRDFPAIDGTSRLSAYFSIGALSAKDCFQDVLVHYPEAIETDFKSGIGVWLSQMIWREFYYHLLASFPELSRNAPFLVWTDAVQWRINTVQAQAWQAGKTGFPLIDAAMRQLNATGWMHNRLRMLVASFWCKDLLFDWRVGEQWFLSQLVDGDFALNNGGWQWSASTGTDAVPYFRIFNPTTQSERFDSKGDFIRYWLPELSSVPNRYLHEPHLWSEFHTIDYPEPIVDHKMARLRAIDAYRLAKETFK